MPSNYKKICEENKRKYGTEIPRIGRILLADRYEDRTHFIFELLQNAEDAMRQRKGWSGSRSVNFFLQKDHLEVSHFGEPFSERDVIGVCGIGEGAKGITDIGGFGIGFKSVYAFTDQPSIYSGDENFTIESYVWPAAEKSAGHDANKTAIVLPFKPDDSAAHDEIKKGLHSLGTRALLFLREINEIMWRAVDGQEGVYLRDDPEFLDECENIRRVKLLGQETDQDDIEETYLVFSKPVGTEEHPFIGYAEIAFALSSDPENEKFSVAPINNAKWIVSFPTAIETHTGFLIQGPYRTTPSRDNIPARDPWNQRLVTETGILLVEALLWLRDKELLDVVVLETLPLNENIFEEEHKLRPLYDCSVKALTSESLLPRHGGGYISAAQSKLARTGDLRELFSPGQLAQIYNADGDIYWLSGTITDDRTPQIRNFLMRGLEVAEITPERIVKELSEEFLTAQSDDWITSFYKFAANKAAVKAALHSIPVIRLENGSHVCPSEAFLPGKAVTDFPTVRKALCRDEEVMDFLQSLGLEEPDSVDDVIEHVLPKYKKRPVEMSDAEYSEDISRILKAYETDSKMRGTNLVSELSAVTFVKSIDAKKRTKFYTRPDVTYMATENMKKLFGEIEGVYLVDDSQSCLRGENIRKLLEACGVSRYLQRIKTETSLDYEYLRKARGVAGEMEYATTEDHTLRGLSELLDSLATFDAETRLQKADSLWRALCELCDPRRANIFNATHKWHYVKPRQIDVEAEFIRILQSCEWAPTQDGQLVKPKHVVFEELEARGWKREPFLLEKIRFKPSEQDTLAEASGVPPENIILLQESKIPPDELRQLLEGAGKMPKRPETGTGNQLDERRPEEDEPASKSPAGDENRDKPEEPSDSGADGASPAVPESSGNGGTQSAESGNKEDSAGKNQKPRQSAARETKPGETKARPIIARPGGHGSGVGAGESNRKAEDEAVEFIIREEHEKRGRTLHRMENPNNEGFDLVERDENGREIRWIEVKARRGVLADTGDGAVSMSKKQLGVHAREKGENYWLYIVENVGGAMKLHRIQDPWGKTGTFLLGSIWTELAEPD